jgi:hypothetical protein
MATNQRALTHKPFDIMSEAHQVFTKCIKATGGIENQVDISAEKQQVLAQIVKEVNR